MFILIETDAEVVGDVAVIPPDPRDGPGVVKRVLAAGSARECLLAAAGECSSAELNQDRLHDLHEILMHRAGVVRQPAKPQPHESQ